MIFFKLLRIRKLIKEGTRNPGGLASEETRGALLAFLILPGIGTVLWLALMFILGFTKLLGGPWGLFKFVFIVSLIGAMVLIWIMWKLLHFLGKTAKKATEQVLQKKEVRNIIYTNINENE